jgi:hypothetical protein
MPNLEIRLRLDDQNVSTGHDLRLILRQLADDLLELMPEPLGNYDHHFQDLAIFSLDRDRKVGCCRIQPGTIDIGVELPVTKRHGY